MRRAVLAGLFITALAAHGAWVVHTQSAKPPGKLRIEKVTGDLYMISGEGGNVAVYVTGEGVVLVDDMFDRNHADILAQVKSITDQPLKYVINTHQHDDHAGGALVIVPASLLTANQKSMELWLIPTGAGAQPRSLGLIAPSQAVRITVPPNLAPFVTPDASLAVSLEEPGGSRTGMPSNDIIAVGKLTNL